MPGSIRLVGCLAQSDVQPDQIQSQERDVPHEVPRNHDDLVWLDDFILDRLVFPLE
jgi:hypothetical protein